MILFIEPISKNISMYVPAYPLPLMEIGSFVKANIPRVEIGVISIPMDYGLPLTREGKEQIYKELLEEISELKPKGIGISCTAIAQAEETIHLCEFIKDHEPDVFIFLGGYFPTIYYEEILSRTHAIDLIVIGEGEIPALEIVKRLERAKDPRDADIPNLAWKKDGYVHLTRKGVRFDLNDKVNLNLELLRHPGAYDILPYAFSRGCPYHCNFCMEEYIRPARKTVPPRIIREDLMNLSQKSNTHSILISDALFKSFNIFPFLSSLGLKATLETRCDVLDPSIISRIADACDMLALGFESASFNTLRRMNKVKDKEHYEHYVSNTISIFKEAIRNEIPIMIFMIAGYPGDTEEDLEKSLLFARQLSKMSGPGGHVFKIGECRVYPKTKVYGFASSHPDVIFDDDGVFGDNIVRKPSTNLYFKTILSYMTEIFNLSNITPKLMETILNTMPFFRLPAHALQDSMIPDICFRGNGRAIFNAHTESLVVFRALMTALSNKYEKWMSKERSTRSLSL